MKIPYDNPRIHLYTRIQKSPFFYASRRHGVQSYSVCNRMYHPRHYDDMISEYWKLVNGVTLWDVGVERQVEITGPDACRFTDMLSPRDLTRCEVGQCKYTLLTDEQGRVLNNPVLLRLGEDHFWLSVADGDVLYWVKGVAVHSGMDVRVQEPDVGPVQIQGPRAKDVMRDLLGERILSLRYYYATEEELDGMDLVISRTGYTGEVGYEVYLRNARRDGQKLWNAILEAGEPHGIDVIGPCQIRRVEAGIHSYGSDMVVDNEMLNPYELGLDKLVELERGADFIGKAALRRIHEQGVSRKLAGVEIEGDPLIGYIEDYLQVLHGDDQVGLITSAFYSPRLKVNIGYALVPMELADPGTELRVAKQAGVVDARVVEKPFIDPKKEIPKT